MIIDSKKVITGSFNFTENADKKCKQLVKKALKTNPSAFVTIVGCYAQLKPEEIGKIPGVDLVLGANEKFDIISYIENTDKKEEATIAYKNIKETKSFVPSVTFAITTEPSPPAFSTIVLKGASTALLMI